MMIRKACRAVVLAAVALTLLSPEEGAGGDFSGLTVGGGAGMVLIDAPLIEYGTIIETIGVPGAESPITRSKRGLTGYRLSLDADLDIDPRRTVGAHVGYREGEGRQRASVAPGAILIATTYLDRAPNGPTGLALGATGADVEIDSRFKKWEADFVYRHNVSGLLGVERILDLILGGGVGYRRFTQRHGATQTSPTFTGIRSETEVDSTTNLIGPRFEVTIGSSGFPMLQPVPVRGSLTAFVIPGYRFDSGEATQLNICNVCVNPQNAFRITRTSDDSGFGLSTGFTGRVGVEVLPGIVIGVEGGFEHTNKVSVWDLPFSPLRQPARMTTDPANVGFVGAYLQVIVTPRIIRGRE